MNELILNEKIINTVKIEATKMVSALLQDNLVEIILYGSCARGDYTNDSDIDIALITKCDRMEVKKYDEYAEKKIWYAYFRNIDQEGEVLYG
jgi:predicted nucleotidyltransferase